MIGFINLYKEKGQSSFENISRLSKLLKGVKLGHAGTLDPIAEGVLPVCVNEATKLSSYIMAHDKEYLCGLKLGFKTDSYDITGNITGYGVPFEPSIGEVEKAIEYFTGEIELDIPAYSAVSINGTRAYKLARTGSIDNAGIRKSKIYDIKLIHYKFPDITIALKVEKGTYVRSIVNKIGEILGTFACMEHLVRTRNGEFGIENAFRVDEIAAMAGKNDYSFVIPVNRILKWSRVIVKKESVQLVKNGISVKFFHYKYLPENCTDMVFITTDEGTVLGIAKKQTGEIPFKNIKIFSNDEFKIV